MIKTVLFDLDGTLLPLDQDYFIECYFKSMARAMSVHGYEPKAFMKLSRSHIVITALLSRRRYLSSLK